LTRSNIDNSETDNAYTHSLSSVPGDADAFHHWLSDMISDTPSLPNNSLYRSQIDSDLMLEEAFRRAHITQFQERQAIYNSSSQGLWSMIQNHGNAFAIVKQLGLVSGVGGDRVQNIDGLELTENKVVTYLRWTARTFAKKSHAYQRARIYATYAWVEPSQLIVRKHTTRTAHSIWRGMVAMFGAGGFSEQAHAPQASQGPDADTDEHHAALLSQNEVYDLHKILAHLDPPQ
jgi:hypothetical protein